VDVARENPKGIIFRVHHPPNSVPGTYAHMHTHFALSASACLV
jgi:hypothetical protein